LIILTKYIYFVNYFFYFFEKTFKNVSYPSIFAGSWQSPTTHPLTRLATLSYY